MYVRPIIVLLLLINLINAAYHIISKSFATIDVIVYFSGIGNLLGLNRRSGEVDNYQSARYTVVARYQVYTHLFYLTAYSFFIPIYV